MVDLIADSEELKPDTIGLQLQLSYNYWYKHRFIFNVVVGVAGFIPTMIHLVSITVIDIVGIIIWGFTVNAFYSTGYSLESFLS